MSQDGTEPTGGSATRQGGFSTQPLWLRLLLIVSVGAVVVGIVRCSIESTAPVARAVSSVAVMPVRVDAPEGFFTQPGDTVAMMAATWFTRSFARETGVQIDVIRSQEDIPEVLREDSPYDGLVYFTLERTYDEEEDAYLLRIHGEIVHTETKRPMAMVDYEAPAGFLYRRMTEAGGEMARKMGYVPPAEAGGEE